MVDFGQIKSVAGSLLPSGGVKDLINSGGRSLLAPDSPISALMSEITKAGGLAAPNQFEVEFFFPSESRFGGLSARENTGRAGRIYQINKKSARQVKMSCEQAAIPSKSIHTTQTRYYGPDINYAYAQKFAPLDMIFRVHNNLVERKFFEAWQESAIDSDTYDANYYDEYVAKIVIKQYGPPSAKVGIIKSIMDQKMPNLGALMTQGTGVAKSFGKAGQRAAGMLGIANAAFNKYAGLHEPNGKVIADYTLIDAFPKFISQLELDHKTQNMYHRQQVSFEFRKWETNLRFNSNNTTPTFSGIGERIKSTFKKDFNITGKGGAFDVAGASAWPGYSS